MAAALINIADQPVMPPPGEMLVHSGSLEGRSNYGSSTDMSRLNPEFDPNDDPNRSHHLLKHCLSNGQRNEALFHFSTDDVKEAAKEISKMGQRDLQSKFRLVYGTATHSNNNDWLRRKLYEAIGAAPIKATTKTKPRKATTSSKPKKTAAAVDPSYHTSSAAAPSSESGDVTGERRSRRSTKGVHSCRNVVGGGTTVAESLKRYRLGGGSLPGSPIVGRSVVDMNRYLGHESAATSASEDEAGAWGSHQRARDGDSATEDGNNGGDVAIGQGGNGRAVRRRASADVYLANDEGGRPHSAFAHASRSMDLPQLPPHLRKPSMMGLLPSQSAAGTLARRASSAGLLGFPTPNLEFLNASDVWSSDAWADAALKAAAARKAPEVTPSAEDEDVMMLPMDLSAFNEDGAALL